ncbi:MAG: DUF1360 domain-containing protein [Chloroflexota bacterium]|nr:DUF1360 domain-containing protein [Chloroflexota bacterium]
MAARPRPLSAFAANTNEDRPLPAYLGLTTLYNSLFASLLLVAVRSGRRLPERVGMADVLLFGVATFQLSRIITRDKVTSAVRAPFTELEDPGADGTLTEAPRGGGLQHAIGELLTCPFCISQWIATALMGGLLFAPRVTRIAASVLSIVALSDFLQYAREFVRKQAEARCGPA